MERTPVVCPHCSYIVNSRSKSGRTVCTKCRKSFIFDKERFLEHNREYVSRPEVAKRIRKWAVDHQEYLREYAKKRYWAKHDHIRKLNNLATARHRGTSSKSNDAPCEICGQKHNRMHRHHIVPMYINGKDEADNLIVVCNKHHQLIEQKKIGFDALNETFHLALFRHSGRRDHKFFCLYDYKAGPA